MGRWLLTGQVLTKMQNVPIDLRALPRFTAIIIPRFTAIIIGMSICSERAQKWSGSCLDEQAVSADMARRWLTSFVRTSQRGVQTGLACRVKRDERRRTSRVC
jgi:hypothetical protein